MGVRLFGAPSVLIIFGTGGVAACYCYTTTAFAGDEVLVLSVGLNPPGMGSRRVGVFPPSDRRTTVWRVGDTDKAMTRRRLASPLVVRGVSAVSGSLFWRF